ncbi:MAG: 30S ribosomal protein S20 [Candidatus Gottesmanbacteria bacterium]|nr:30S ribosomal protein S20 [Candidatus Gottesmanbacteria bacterium]
MPITKQAEKKLRHDRKRTMETKRVHAALQKLVKSMRKKPTQKSLTQVFAALDKAAKTHIIHKNKAARLKARLAKLLAKK